MVDSSGLVELMNLEMAKLTREYNSQQEYLKYKETQQTLSQLTTSKETINSKINDFFQDHHIFKNPVELENSIKPTSQDLNIAFGREPSTRQNDKNYRDMSNERLSAYNPLGRSINSNHHLQDHSIPQQLHQPSRNSYKEETNQRIQQLAPTPKPAPFATTLIKKS
jgi:hypothetical protein